MQSSLDPTHPRQRGHEALRFESEVIGLDDVIACYSAACEADFLWHIVSSDLDTYADFAMRIIRRLPGIKEMHTMFVLKDIKQLTSLPLKITAA